MSRNVGGVASQFQLPKLRRMSGKRVAGLLVIFTLGGCAPKEISPPQFLVQNGDLEIPTEIAAGQTFTIRGQFDVVSDIDSRTRGFATQVKILKVTPTGKTVTVASENVKRVTASGRKRTFEIMLDAPKPSGSYNVQAFAAGELAAEGKFLVK